ncbi:MAG: SDR family oxidoreductase [Sphingomonadales bacterium]|nr:SDR family oxidoreductase [Sphingomonadales bacterium]MBK9267622.1 SDR family oxidoreductase [Sphingomonadales bacterium]
MLMANRHVLLTGASSGVGRHLARTLAGHGAKVSCCARRGGELATLVKEIGAAGGVAAALPCDVRDAQSIRDAFDSAEDMFGPVDSVIVNAGINIAGPAQSLSVDNLDAILGVNLRGAFLTAQEGGRRMIGRGRPVAGEARRIIFIASILGKAPDLGAVAYAASKAGVLMLAKALAKEWARHEINVNAILPGYMPTDIVAEWFETDKGKAQIEGWPRRRLMPVEDLDGAVLYLLSSAARSVSGAELQIDDTQSLA